MKSNIYTVEHKRIAQALRAARIKSKMSQQEVALKLNKPQSYVSKSEAGERRIDVVELKKFADIYKVDINIFINQ